MSKLIIVIVILIAVASGVVFWRYTSGQNQPKEPEMANLVFWSVQDDQDLLRPIIKTYEDTHPKVKINYVSQNLQNYRVRSQTQIANNQGPDIFMIHNSWLPMFTRSNYLSPLPSEVMAYGEYIKSFYPVAAAAFIRDNKIYGVSGYVDGLALFVNADILKAAAVEIPKTWPEFVNAAVRVTVKDSTNKITTAGAAIGSTNNVQYWAEILGLLFYQQPNANLENPTNKESSDVLRFYSDFVTSPDKKVWDPGMEDSLQAFASGRLAFYFGYSDSIKRIKTLNPQLSFVTAPVPKLPGSNIGWASFWGYSVSSRSRFPQQSWEFLNYLTSEEVQKQLYQQETTVNMTSRPYSRVSLQETLLQDPLMAPFASQANNYKFWYLQSDTRDQGINDEIRSHYQKAVDSAAGNKDPGNSLKDISGDVKKSLDKYITVPVPSPQ